MLALGTTGEGILLSLDERRRAAEAFVAAVASLTVAHCGAQTTADDRRARETRSRGGRPASP